MTQETSYALPSAAEALARAVAAGVSANTTSSEAAAESYSREGMLWLGIAREIREGTAGYPAEDVSPDRLTLHDVEGIVCSHGRVAVRRKNATARWFLHSDDGSNCATPMAETEHDRRASEGEVRRARRAVAEESAVTEPIPQTYGTTMDGTPTYGRPESLEDTHQLVRPFVADSGE